MYRPQDPSAGNETPSYLSAASATFQNSPFGYSPFPNLATGSHSNDAAHRLSPIPHAQGGQHAGHQQRLSTDAQVGSMGTSSSSTSPRLGNVMPTGGADPSTTRPTDRSLPSRYVTSDNIAETYASFILYCNPNFPLDVDVSALKANFQNPPKSDNKEFEIFRLYELIRKFDAKEIKTWGQLALDLGVEPPDVSKGQSVQKVQQYSVRLKRWMRAMHADAFFEFLLGKQHTYFIDIPHPSDPYPPGGRDGVVAEEDLAIRALDPSFRPKRGRRRNSEVEAEEEAESGTPSKHPRLLEGSNPYQLASAAPMSAAPMSAHPNTFNDPWAAASAVTPQSLAPWSSRPTDPQSTVGTTAPAQFRWQLHGKSNDLNSPHPMSARHTSMAAHIDAAFDNEPKSAVTPAGRKRRKHGPAVSSAWPSTSGSGSKPRGRPPASRSVQDGPYSTFPADPARDTEGSTNTTPPPDAMEPQPGGNTQQQLQNLPPIPLTRPSEFPGRPGRLSLQVPQHTGAPVRLATPPRVVINSGSNETSRDTSPPRIIEAPPQPGSPKPIRKIRPVGEFGILEREVPGFAFEVLKRVLTSDLLRAELIGRKNRLSGDEAKRLAHTILDRLKIPLADTDDSRDDISRLTAASWLGLGEQLRVPLGPAVGRNKKLTVTRFRIDAEGYEEVVSAHDDSNNKNTGEDDSQTADTPTEIREVFDLSWSVSMGGCNGSFEMKGLALSDTPLPKYEDTHDLVLRSWKQAMQDVGMSHEWTSRALGRAAHQRQKPGFVAFMDPKTTDEDVDWKTKYFEVLFGLNVAKGEFDRIRDRLIERVLDILV